MLNKKKRSHNETEIVIVLIMTYFWVEWLLKLEKTVSMS